jgi:NDP-sugar pyrophosphorylase family protein
MMVANSASGVRVVVLAGGRGTRLQPFTVTFPKPLVPLGDMPILEILLRRLHAQGLLDVTLTLGHLSELIRAFLDQRAASAVPDMQLTYVVEDEPTGTAGSLSLVEGLNSTFLAMNGDLLTDLPFGELLAHHRASGAELTIASHAVTTKIDLGVLELDDAGELVGYREKPQIDHRVSMGVYVYEPSVLDLIPQGRHFDFPELVVEMLRQGRKVAVYPFDGLWLDVGRPEDYARAQALFAENRGRFLPGGSAGT